MAKINFIIKMGGKNHKAHFTLEGQELYFFKKFEAKEEWIKDVVRKRIKITDIEIEEENFI